MPNADQFAIVEEGAQASPLNRREAIMDKFARSEAYEQIREPWNKGKAI
jgi:hypothetical protein